MKLYVNCPKKPMAFARVWGCMLLLLIATILSFMPLISLQIGESNTAQQIEDLLLEIADGDPEITNQIDSFLSEFPDKVNVSAVDIVSCVGTLVDFAKLASSEDAGEDAAAAFADMLQDEKGQKSLQIVAGIVIGVTDSLDLKSTGEAVAQNLVQEVVEREIGAHADELVAAYVAETGNTISTEDFLYVVENEGLSAFFTGEEPIFDELGLNIKEIDSAIFEATESTKNNSAQQEADLSENIFMMILNIMVVLVCLIAVLSFTVIAPVIYVISALIALISALVHVKEPEAAGAKVSKQLTKLIKIPLLLMLFQCVLPTMTYSSGALTLLILSLVCVVFNLVLSRLHSYTEPQIKYANVLQGVSLVGVIGYLVFFFNVLKAGVFNTFLNGKLGSQLMNVMMAAIAKETVGSNAYIIDIVMIVLTLIFVLISVNYFRACLQRLSCSIPVSKKGSKIKDIQLARAILMLPIYILPMVVAGSKHYFEDVTATGTGDASLLVLSDASNAAMSGILVGIILILVAEIALIVLKTTLCRDVSAEDMGNVMRGIAIDEPVLAEETVAAEEAPAEEAPAEEAPAEEAPAEEAPVEEAPVEEAPVEETTEA